jgi:hypothetical protein
MQMRKARRVIAGAGLLMFGAIVTLASTLWSPWIQINATTVVRLMVVLGVGALICLLFWLFTRDQEIDATQTSPKSHHKIEAPLTANSTSYGNVVNVYPPALAPEPPPPPVAKALNDDRNPELSLKLGWGTVEQEFGKFEFSETSGKRAYIVEVINNPASTLGVAYPARRIVARVTFKCLGKHLFIDRAFWVGREENEIDLDVGKTAQILVGVVRGTQWTLYENPSTLPLNQMEWDAVHEEPIVREFPDMGSEPILIEIHIISMADHHQRRTLAHKRIIVEINEEQGSKQIRTRFI